MNSNKKRKIKRVLVWALVILMVLPTLVTMAMLIRADEISDLKAGLEEARAEQENRQDLIANAKEQQEILDVQLESTKKELQKLKDEQASIFEQKTLLDTQIGLLNDRIAVIDSTVITLQESIEEYGREIEALDKQYEETYAGFKNRIRVAYEDGTASYLAVIFEAQSIAELVSRIQMVSDILSNDRSMMEELELLGDTIAIKRESLANEQAEFIAMTETLNTERWELQVTVDESTVLMSELADEETANVELLAEYERLWQDAYEEEQRLMDEYEAARIEIENNESALSSAIESKEEAESKYLAWSISESIKKEQEAAAKPPAYKPNGGSSSSSGNGKYIWPTPGYYWVTSEFGGRWHPVTGQWNSHSGIDIGAPYGCEVLAIASGTVIQSGYDSIFGYCIRIDHGDGVVSLYGHFKKWPEYNVGDWVGKGAVVGYVGSTGMSTGAHLHITTYQWGVLTDPERLLTK